MSRDHDEADLYPPDVDVVTKEAASQRNRAVVGVSLVTLGCGLMLERILDNDLDYFWLALGFGLLAGWMKVPRFPMFAVGAIMTGFGLGGLVESFGRLRFESTLGLLLATAGFLAVYVRYPTKGRWALIPAAVFAALAFADFGVGLIGLIPGAVTGMLLPLVLIGAGVLLVFRNRLPAKLVSCGVVAAALIFVSAAASSVGDWHRGDNDRDFTFAPPMAPSPVSPKPLRIVTDEGDVEITVDPTVTEPDVRVSGEDSTVRMTNGDDAIEIRPAGPRRLFGNDFEDATHVVVVPPGYPVEIVTDEGLVRGTYGGGSLDITSDEGDVELTLLEPTTTEGTPLTGSIRIRTSEGDVGFDGAGSLTLALTARSESGDVEVDDVEQESSRYEISGDGGHEVDISTDDGDIQLVHLRPAA